MGLLGIPDPSKWAQQNSTKAIVDKERVNENNYKEQKLMSRILMMSCCIEMF